MKQLPEWQQLDHAVTSEKCTTFRRIIAIHTSTCCQRKKQVALVKSLTDVGLDAALVGHDGVAFQIALPKVFDIGSNNAMQPFTYRSAAHVDKKQAKKSVARCC